MDVNTTNINGNSVNNLSTLSSTVDIKSLGTIREIDNNSTNSFSVDSTSISKRSELSNSLKEFVKEISIGQSNMTKIQEQSTILNNIKDIAKDIINSENPIDIAEISQPTVQEHMEKYNSISQDISGNLKKFQEATDSTTYFDGRLGARPLSTSEILDAVEKQMEMINQQLEYSLKELEKLETKALDTIGEEVTKSAAEAPFEPIDFGKDIGSFSSANINNILGSVVASQANAIPGHSPKLLS